ncbi:MAG: fumarylacetoacetate hydrolase family protein [Alphaproteobacteria bacterium]|nr:fumarylacetoacetate hydrolase family protein [Alphaproteobacteria bacterium]
MKLLRYGPAGKEKPGLLDDDGKIRDLSKVVDDITPDVLSPRGLAAIRKRDPKRLPIVKGRPRLGPPVVERRVFAIGLNYAKHAAEAGMKIPDEPILFTKTCPLTGPNDRIVLPKGSKKGDWEVELCFVMGRKAQYVSKKDALKYVAGYAAGNDVSERKFQIESGGQWVKGKSSDTFGPLGPWLVTTDEIKNPQNLQVWLDVNGERMQEESTKDMIFSCADIISYLSKMITLHPGDVIYSGTPSGVGLGIKPKPKFLKPRDVITLGVEGLGEHKNKVVSWDGKSK